MITPNSREDLPRPIRVGEPQPPPPGVRGGQGERSLLERGRTFYQFHEPNCVLAHPVSGDRHPQSKNPEEGSFAFSFIFKRAFSPAEIKELRESLTESLYAMLELKNQQPSVLEDLLPQVKGVQFLELKRDILSFRRKR